MIGNGSNILTTYLNKKAIVHHADCFCADVLIAAHIGKKYTYVISLPFPNIANLVLWPKETKKVTIKLRCLLNNLLINFFSHLYFSITTTIVCILFFLCILLLPSRRRNNLQEVIAVQSRPKFAYEIVENDLNSNQNKAKNEETEIQKGVVLRALPDYGEVIIYYPEYIHKNKVKKVEQHNFVLFPDSKTIRKSTIGNYE